MSHTYQNNLNFATDPCNWAPVVRCSFSQLPAGSVPHKMTAKAGEGEAAERKQRLKLLLPLWHCFLSCAAQQQQKCLADASSIIYGSVDESSPLVGKSAHLYCLATKPIAQIRHSLATIRSVRLITISFAFCTWFPLKRLGITACKRAEVEAATRLWMAAKFCWFRAEKSKAGRILSGRQFTVHFHHCSYPEMNLAIAFFHREPLVPESG